MQAQPVEHVGLHPRLLVGGVGRREQRAVRMTPHHQEHPWVTGVPDLGRHRGVQVRQGGAHGQQVPQPDADAVRVGGGRAVRRPRHPGAVHPAVVGGVGGVVGPARVVEQAHLVAHPEHRQPAEPEDHGVRPEDAGHRVPVAGLKAGQRGERPRDPTVTGGLVVLEHQAAGPRPGEGPGVPVGEEAAVRGAVDADCVRVVVGDRPADVVVAAHVGHPGGGRGRLRQPLERTGGEPDLA